MTPPHRRAVAVLLAATLLTSVTGTLVLLSSAPASAHYPPPPPPAPAISGAGALIVTADSTPTIGGTAAPGAKITGAIGAQPCTAVANGVGAWSCTAPASVGGDGDYAISVRATVSNQYATSAPSAPATATLRLDTTPPPVPQFTAPYNTVSGAIPRLVTTAEQAPPMSGSAEPGAHIIVLYAPGVPPTGPFQVYCEADANSAGAWTCAGPTLPPGSYSIAGVAVDSLGNRIPDPSGGAFALVITAPAAPPPPPPQSQPQPPAPRTVPPRAEPLLAIPFDLHLAKESGESLDGLELTVGDRLILWGSGLPPGSGFSAELHSKVVVIGAGTVRDDGEFRVLITLPDDISPGVHEFVVTVTVEGRPPSTATRTAVIAARAPPQPLTRSHAIAQTQADVVAVAASTPSGDSIFDPTIFGNSLVPVQELVLDAGTLAIAGGISLLFLFLIAFPAELLEGTFRENYHRAFRWLDPVRHRVTAISDAYKKLFKNPWVASLMLIVVAALLFGSVDPEFGLNGKSARLVIAMAVSLAILNIGAAAVVISFGRKRFSVANRIEPMPAALIVVVLSVALSRFTGITPAFFFGLVVGLVWTHRQAVRDEGRLALLLMSLTLAVGVGSFLAYSALHESHDEGFWHELALETTAALALESIGILLIALLPLRFLDGRRIFRWSRTAWGAIYFVSLVAFVLIMTPVAEAHGLLEDPGWGWIVAFVGFAVLSVIIWALFRFIPAKDEGEELDELAQVSVGATASSPDTGSEPPPPPPR